MADVTVDVVNKKETAMSTATADANGEARAVPSRSRIEHPSKRERAARGKTARAEVPRSAHADWEPPAGRRDPVAALLEEEQTRLPELVPLRHGRMAASPFTFYRGAAGLMAADLAGAPRTGLQVQLCGDAHLSNFGAFAAPDRRLIFGLNDFDETLPGPFEWDVKRFVASIAIAGRDRGFTAKQREPINLAAGRSYQEAMRAFAAMRVLDVWYARLDVEQIAKRWSSEVSGKQLKRFDRNVAKARAKDSQRAADKLTHVVAGDVRIVSAPPLIVPIEELAEDQAAIEDLIRTVVRSYRRTLASDRRHLPEASTTRTPRAKWSASQGGRAVGAGTVSRQQQVPPQRTARRRGPAADAVGRRHHARLDPRAGRRRRRAPVLHAPAVGRQGFPNHRGDGTERADRIRGDVRLDAGARARARPLRRRSGDRRLPRIQRRVRPRARVFAEVYADQNELDYAAFSKAIDSGEVTAETGL